MTKITQSFIFAAGRGERMRPITDSIPKPLVKIKNKSIIDYIIEKLDKTPQIEKIVINGFYLAQQIEDHIKNLANRKIIFSREDSKIETGGGLLFALKNHKFDQNQPILLINGDILWQESQENDEITDFCQKYQKNDCDILLGLKKTGEVLGYEGEGDFNLDEKTGKILASENKSRDYVFVGLQIINPEILKFAPENFFSMNYFYKNADALGIKIKGVELKSKFFHISDVKGLKAIEEVL